MTELFTQNNTVVDPDKDYFVDLVGEGKKFKSERDLARGKVESDLFIERLKNEMDGLRQELNTRMTLEQYMEKIKEPLSSPPPNPNQNTNSGNEGDNQLPLSKIEEIVERKAAELAAKRIQEDNVRQTVDVLKTHFGNDYVPRLQEATEALGVSKDFMNQLAKEQPKAFLKLLGIGETVQQKAAPSLFTPPQSQTQTFRPSANKKNFSYYENIRKTDPKAYWDKSTQNEMHRMAHELQEEFYS